MELIFPWVVIIGIVVVIALPFIGFKKGDKYRNGHRVANTSLVEETELYKKLMRNYKVICGIALGCALIGVGVCFVIMSRPAKYETITYEIPNRDIFFCMDVSSSMDEVNLEMCDEIRELVKDLNGERIGITIFNGKSILLVPLTTDYDYVLSIIDKLEASCEESLKVTEMMYSGSYSWDWSWDYETYNYKYEGTLSDYGSSFIGDGLASTLFNFPDLNENPDRTRLIIFTTDNELNGEPLVTVDEAAALCAKHDVSVFAIGPEYIVDKRKFEDAIESTGGKLYQSSDSGAYDDLLEEIRKTEASNYEVKRSMVYDQPQLWFIVLLVFEGLYLFMCRRAKL